MTRRVIKFMLTTMIMNDGSKGNSEYSKEVTAEESEVLDYASGTQEACEDNWTVTVFRS